MKDGFLAKSGELKVNAFQRHGSIKRRCCLAAKLAGCIKQRSHYGLLQVGVGVHFLACRGIEHHPLDPSAFRLQPVGNPIMPSDKACNCAEA